MNSVFAVYSSDVIKLKADDRILDTLPPTPLVYPHAGAAFLSPYVGTRHSAARVNSRW